MKAALEDAEGWRDDLRGELEECLVCILLGKRVYEVVGIQFCGSGERLLAGLKRSATVGALLPRYPLQFFPRLWWLVIMVVVGCVFFKECPSDS